MFWGGRWKKEEVVEESVQRCPGVYDLSYAVAGHHYGEGDQGGFVNINVGK